MLRYVLILLLLCALGLVFHLYWSDEREIDDLPQAQLPVLKIDGKENADVYLQSLEIQVEVTGNIAATRYVMVFKNKTNNILEGELTFSLPEGRSVTHYALDVNGKMREAVPVEKAKGTQVFEEIEQGKVDPGLLERVEGNNLRTRVYPIPANGVRTIEIGYEEELALENELLYYSLPMAYPNPLEKFAVKVTVLDSAQKPVVPSAEKKLRFNLDSGSYVASFASDNYQPKRALVFALPVTTNVPQVIMQAERGSHYFLASVVPKVEMRKKQWSDDLALIWDVSLSGSQRNLQREMEMLNVLFAEKNNAIVHLYFLNNRLKSKGKYEVANGQWNALKNALEAAIFDGGTDFSQIDLDSIAGDEILFFSDGISTLSEADFFKNANIKRPIHCTVSSLKADYSAMKLIADETGGKFLNANVFSLERLKNELLNQTMQFLGVEHGEKVREVYPSIAAPVYGNFSVAGILDTSTAEVDLLFGFDGNVEKRIKVQLNASNAANKGNIHRIWAQKKIAELDLDYEKNQTELAELGKQFGIVTRNTSLIVLESIRDYFQHDIEPPAELLAEHEKKMNETKKTSTNKHFERTFPKDTNKSFAKNIEKVLKKYSDSQTGEMEFGGRRASNSGGFNANSGYAEGGSGGFSKGSINGHNYDSYSKREAMKVINNRLPGVRRIYKKYLKLKPGLEGKVTFKFIIIDSDITDINIVSSTTGYKDFDNAVKEFVATWKWKQSGKTTVTLPLNFIDDTNINQEEAIANAINLKEWWNRDYEPVKKKPTSHFKSYENNIGDLTKDYMKQLTGKSEEDYQIYLKLRKEHAGEQSFYFDMSGWFYALGDKETALRILTSITELELESAPLYRLLGYRLKEYGEYALEKFVCRKVLKWRPMEPQALRDYALALADNGEPQAALDSLNSMLVTSYPANIKRRSNGIKEVAITEINNLIAKNPKLDISQIDKKLIARIPVDIRIVMNWNMDNTDIDLIIIDPNNEKSTRKNHKEINGERRNADIEDGYGPEQFLLKKAIKGKYKVYAVYYQDTQPTAAAPSTIMAEVYTKYAGEAEQRQIITLQMSNLKKERNYNLLNAATITEFELSIL